MAAKDNNNLVISLSIFVLLTVGLGVAWYMTWSHSSDLQRQVTELSGKENELKSAIQNQTSEITSLRDLIGHPGAAVDEVVTGTKQEIAKRAGDGSAAANTLEGAMIKNAADRDINSLAATDRQIQVNVRTRELADERANHQAQMASQTNKIKQLEQGLLDKERLHGEQLAALNKELDSVKNRLTTTQDEYATYRTTKEREIEDLEKDNAKQRQALITLRREKMKLEGLTFERPDGQLTFIDQNALSCFVDIGSRDELRIGTTFSVYTKNNSGVGRSQSDKDLKGKIEITALLGDHLAEARIVDQKIGNPLAAGDPIYSPLFWPGQKLQIAVVGLLDFDGNPGTDRDEFRRIVNSAGAEIILEVNDEAKILGKNGEELTVADIEKRITSETRFLVVGNLGGEDTQDTAQKAIFNRMKTLKADMELEAENNGVYLLSLASFLDYVGYSRKRLTWSPTQEFPAILANGGKSETVNAPLGRRQSTAAIGGTFSTRRTKPTVSNGKTTKLYESPAREE
jgi:hypothetical protein